VVITPHKKSQGCFFLFALGPEETIMTGKRESSSQTTTPLSIQRLIIITLLSWLSQIIFDFFQNAGLFAKLWIESRSALLPPEQLFERIPLGYLSFLITSSMFVWLMVRLGISGSKQGALFGLKIGAFLSCSYVLGTASAFPIKPALLIAILFGSAAQSCIAAGVIGSGLSGAHLGRLSLKLIAFLILVFIAYFLLQSLGLAPPMQQAK
jgi:hypothetical protein